MSTAPSIKCIFLPARSAPKILTLPPHLTALQHAVGGYIEHIALDKSMSMLVHEEGKLFGHPFNAAATRIARIAAVIHPDDVIVGNVLIVGAARDGNFTDVPETAIVQAIPLTPIPIPIATEHAR